TNFIDDSVSVINPATNTRIATIFLGDSGPEGVAVSPTGPQAGDVYVVSYASGAVSVIDPATHTVVPNIHTDHPGSSHLHVRPPAPQARPSPAPAPTPPVTSLTPPATNTVVATIPVSFEPFGVAVSPTGPEAGDLYVTNVGNDTVTVIT